MIYIKEGAKKGFILALTSSINHVMECDPLRKGE